MRTCRNLGMTDTIARKREKWYGPIGRLGEREKDLHEAKTIFYKEGYQLLSPTSVCMCVIYNSLTHPLITTQV